MTSIPRANNRRGLGHAGGKTSISCIALGFTIMLACYNYIMHIANFHRYKCADDGVAELRQRHTNQHDTVPSENDSLAWITAKPNKARRVGYEDDWLMAWKDRHYSPEVGTRCVYTTDYTPYDDGLMCTIPGYIPARIFVPRDDDDRTRNKRMISKVIFVSWFDRRLGPGMFTSLLTLIHHNPEYEFIFFDDDDVDRFLCETSREEWAIPILSRVMAGAMRADIWRLLIMQRYGGVYVDSDISAIGKIPIKDGDTAVSGVGCWSHLPAPADPWTDGKPGGLLEHWAIAFMPHHPFINAAVSVMKENLLRPEYLLRSDTPEAVAEESVTIRITGPAMYQWALHDILNKSKCEMIEMSYCEALWNPEKHCGDMETFRSYFPRGERFFRRVNLNETVRHKLFLNSDIMNRETEHVRVSSMNYDDPLVRISNLTDPTFCDADAFESRANRRERIFMKDTN